GPLQGEGRYGERPERRPRVRAVLEGHPRPRRRLVHGAGQAERAAVGRTPGDGAAIRGADRLAEEVGGNRQGFAGEMSRPHLSRQDVADQLAVVDLETLTARNLQTPTVQAEQMQYCRMD